VRDLELLCPVPAGLIEDDDGVGAGGNLGGDLVEVKLWVAKYKSGGDRSLKQTAAMWPPRVTVKRGCNS